VSLYYLGQVREILYHLVDIPGIMKINPDKGAYRISQLLGIQGKTPPPDKAFFLHLVIADVNGPAGNLKITGDFLEGFP
jgi:hypothetical protein